ncbi:MAG TPA: VOC family protein [Acidimicrobiales bacterium]|nr:VOC family protein [Acidimicrobiales bacterium]
MPSITGGHHIAFTVTDADRSARFYEDLLGMQVVMQGDEDDVRFRVLMCPGSGWVVGVRQYLGKEEGPFDEFRCGLDHFAFTVGSMDELQAWERTLEDKGVPHSPIAETPIGTVIVFRDPDDIQLELWLPAA